MKNLLCYLFILFCLSFTSLFSDDDIEVLINKFPSVVTNFSGQTAEKKIVWARSDLLPFFSIKELVINDTQVLIKNEPVSFLSPEVSKQNIPSYWERKEAMPLLIYKWEFETETDGNYFISIPTTPGTLGYLNKEPIIVISNGIISKKGSGKQSILLVKGKNTLYLSTIPDSSSQLYFIPETQVDRIKEEITKKFISNTKENILWVATVFLPYVCNLQNGGAIHFVKLLSTFNKLHPFDKSNETTTLFKSYVTQNNRDGYLIEKYIYQNFPDQYFNVSIGIADNNFLFTNKMPRTSFLTQLIYDGQKTLAENYFNKCVETIKNSDAPEKEKAIMTFYESRLYSLYRIGRMRDFNEATKITSEVCKKEMTIDPYSQGKPDQEDSVTFTQSFDETTADRIKEAILNYEGNNEQLSTLYKTFLSTDNTLVKRNDGAVSLFYLFQVTKNTNEKLKADFQKFVLEKIQPKIDKAKESRDIKLLEEILSQNECVMPMPEIRVILMEEYFKNGFILKALSLAHFLFDLYPNLHEKIISKMVVLENIAEIPNDQKRIIPTNLSKSSLTINGQATTIEKFSNQNAIQSKSLGKLLKTIPLEAAHAQYWNHPQINFYQPIEPIFTKNNIILNGGKYLLSYSLAKNEIEWVNHSEAEYKNDNENGPHQKQFITSHSGNQLFTLTNRDYSDKKTVKCFDLRGNLLWDMSDQKNSLIEESLCTPLEAQGKLFCLNYSTRETINTVNYAVYDAGTGNLILKTPISYIPNTCKDEIGRNIGGNWNTFKQDNHFTQDGSFVYGYTGTGILFKADANSGYLLWEKGFPKSATSNQYTFFDDIAYAPSGYIHLYENVLLSFMPDIQIFTAVDKGSGELIWKSKLYNPKFIHDRGKSNFLYFSNDNVKNEPNIFKVNPLNGETIWQSTTNGLPITGEGSLLGNKLYIPSDKAILVFDAEIGSLAEIIPLLIQPLKIRCNIDNTVILTNNNAYILQNNGAFDPKLLIDSTTAILSSKFIEPDTQPSTMLSAENINLETTLKLPEDYYASGDPWKKTLLLKTSKSFHFLLSCKEHLALFREGYKQKDGKYIPPEILWYGQYPDYAILDDVLYISEYGKIIATNIFTRENLWVYEYNRQNPVFRNNPNKIRPAIAVTKQAIAYQTENQSICVLDRATRNKIAEFYAPSFRSMFMEGNYLVACNNNIQAICYDLSQNGKELWKQESHEGSEFGIENGNFVYVRDHSGTITYYDLKTGAITLNAKATNGSLYIMNNWLLNENILFAFDMLYDSKTGEPLPKYKEGAKVTGGGFIGFTRQYGSEGNYLADGKEYSFTTQCNRDNNNKLFAATRKGNRIIFYSSWFIETFEIVNDKLVSIDLAKFYSGPYGNWEFGTSLFPLNNSMIMIRGDEMYFYNNFDLNLDYQKIKSNRVENKKNSLWPYSETYPEIEVDDKNWISYNGEKSKRKLSYQAFGDDKFAYLKFKLSPKLNNDIKSILYISANGFENIFAITWDTDNWKNAQYTFNIKDNIESWKEVDIQGNIVLYIKLQLISPISRFFKSTLPDFNIELRQMSGYQNDGMFRIGGAYFKNRKFFPWMTYMNDEAETLKDFAIRSNLYEKNINYYPPGDDLIIWLKDRRRFKSIDDNILLLNKMIEKNSKFYCVVNILTALLNEEIFSLKEKQPELNELSDEFSNKLNEIIKRLHKFSLDKGVSKEWVDFALSFWTIEIFPQKLNYDLWRNEIFKAVNGVTLKNEKIVFTRSNFNDKRNPLTPNINQPYLEWVLPGLTPDFPNNQLINSVELITIGGTKTGFGKMLQYTPTGSTEFCNRKGKFTNPAAKIVLIEKQIKLDTKETSYYSKNIRYDCFMTIYPAWPGFTVSLDLPPLKSPAILEKTGQSPESIMTALENLPSDNSNGQALVNYYISLKGNLEEPERIKIYAKWLNSIKDNYAATYHAIRNIYDNNAKNKNVAEFVGNIIKEAKLTPNVPRSFFLERINRFMDKNSRSVLGPYFQELDSKPETNFDATKEYKSGDKVFKFGENTEPKKGGTIYIASKVTVEEKEKVFLFVRAADWLYSSSYVSIWLNGKPIIEMESFTKLDGNVSAQKLNLIQGENIILIKLVGVKDGDWGYYYSINIGDIYGIPIKGVEMKPVHK